jgi:hypothetical protein
MSRDTAFGIEVEGILDERNAHTMQDVIVSVDEPVVRPRDITARIPRAMLEESVWGTPRDVLDYLSTVNAVPQNVNVEMTREEPSGDVIIRFTWWEITARVPRRRA